MGSPILPSMKNTPSPDGLTRHPYRALFPLGWLMLWLALAPWIFFAFQTGVAYPRNLHVLVMIQGALTPFAAGFLFMVMPRRLESPFAAPWQMVFVLLVPPVHAVLVWQQMLGIAHALWAAEALMLLLFAGSRVLGLRAKRRGPAAFVWVPIGFSFGFIGTLLLGCQELFPGWLGTELAVSGWLMLTQGLFMSLVFGIGALFVPLVTHKEPSVDAEQHPDALRRRLVHLMAAFAILLGFALEAWGWVSLGRVLRAVVALAVLLTAARIYRLPRVAGTQRKLIWLASWCLPIGLALAAAIPSRPHIGLHMFFIGGVALITLSVALHVSLAHSTGQELVFKPVWEIRVFGGLVMLALVLRVIAEVDIERHFQWVGGGAMLFLLALLPWGQLVLPRVLPALFSRQ